MPQIELNNHTLVLLSQIAAGEWDGPTVFTQWFTNERGPSSDCLPECSNIGIVERRQKIVELAGMIYAEIEEWADRDGERYEYLAFHNPGWGEWDMDLLPRLLCEAFAAAGINEDNLHTLDGEDAWVRIGEYIHRVADGWRAAYEGENVNDNPITDMDTIDETVRMGRDLIALIGDEDPVCASDCERYENQWVAFGDRLESHHEIRMGDYDNHPWFLKATQVEIIECYILLVEDNGLKGRSVQHLLD